MARWIEILPEESGALGKKPAPSRDEGFLKQEKNSFLEPQSKRENIPLKLQTSGTEELSLKAKRLVEEVRVAIQSLSTSSYLSDPQVAPFRAALAKLKPLVDEMIDSLSKNGLDVQKEGRLASSKHQPLFSKSESLAGESRIAPSILKGSPQLGLKSREMFPSTSPLKELNGPVNQSSEQRTRVDGGNSTGTRNKFPEAPKEKRRTFALTDASPLPKEEIREFQKMKRELSQEMAAQEGVEMGEAQSSRPKTTQPAKTPKEKNGNQADSSLRGSTAPLAMSKTEEERPFLARPSHPIVLPLAQAAVNSILSSALKKKKRKRYFFKHDEREDEPQS